MVIELLGTRIIAPFYGVSLYVWSSLISVALIALAIGYFAGGRWADRAKRTGLSLVISLAALFILLVPWITRPVLLVTDALGLRAGAFVSALVLFSPSLILLEGWALCRQARDLTVGGCRHQRRVDLCRQHARKRGWHLAFGLLPISRGGLTRDPHRSGGGSVGAGRGRGDLRANALGANRRRCCRACCWPRSGSPCYPEPSARGVLIITLAGTLQIRSSEKACTAGCG